MKRPLRFLVTAGPTVEDLDPVRFLSNRATGRLGCEVAASALAAGHRVTLVHGPISETLISSLPKGASVPQRFSRVAVRSSEQMRRAVLARAPRAEVVVMTAAVADFTPARRSAVKLKKSRRGLLLRLKPTVDILAALGRLKRVRLKRLALIGFALETGRGRSASARRRSRIAEALRKLRAKNLDAVVMNAPEAMGAKEGEFLVLRAAPPPGEARRETVRAGKRVLARRLVRLAEALIKEVEGRERLGVAAGRA